MAWRGRDNSIIDVLVVGAGPAGLATAVACLEAGFNVIVLEQAAQVGGWSRHIPEDYYVPGPLDAYVFSYASLNEALPVEPKVRDVRQYLASYAAFHNVQEHIRLSCRLIHLGFDAAGGPHGRWRATFHDLTLGKRYLATADFVVLCTGHCLPVNGLGATPPDMPAPRQAHARAMTPAEVASSTCDVTVIGDAEAVVDYASSLALLRRGRGVSLVVRQPAGEVTNAEPPSATSRGTRHDGSALLDGARRRALQAALQPHYSLPAPGVASRALRGPTKRHFWAFLGGKAAAAVFGDKRSTKNGGDKGPDATVAGSAVATSTPTSALPAPASVTTPAAAAAAEPSHLVLWAPSLADPRVLPFLEHSLRRALLEGAESRELVLYRGVLHPDVAGLAFVGFESHALSSLLVFELQARWLVAHLTSEVALPTPAAMREDVARQRAWRSAALASHLMSANASLARRNEGHYCQQLLGDLRGMVELRAHGLNEPHACGLDCSWQRRTLFCRPQAHVARDSRECSLFTANHVLGCFGSFLCAGFQDQEEPPGQLRQGVGVGDGASPPPASRVERHCTTSQRQLGGFVTDGKCISTSYNAANLSSSIVLGHSNSRRLASQSHLGTPAVTAAATTATLPLLPQKQLSPKRRLSTLTPPHRHSDAVSRQFSSDVLTAHNDRPFRLTSRQPTTCIDGGGSGRLGSSSPQVALLVTSQPIAPHLREKIFLTAASSSAKEPPGSNGISARLSSPGRVPSAPTPAEVKALMSHRCASGGSLPLPLCPSLRHASESVVGTDADGASTPLGVGSQCGRPSGSLNRASCVPATAGPGGSRASSGNRRGPAFTTTAFALRYFNAGGDRAAFEAAIDRAEDLSAKLRRVSQSTGVDLSTLVDLMADDGMCASAVPYGPNPPRARPRSLELGVGFTGIGVRVGRNGDGGDGRGAAWLVPRSSLERRPLVAPVGFLEGETLSEENYAGAAQVLAHMGTAAAAAAQCRFPGAGSIGEGPAMSIGVGDDKQLISRAAGLLASPRMPPAMGCTPSLVPQAAAVSPGSSMEHNLQFTQQLQRQWQQQPSQGRQRHRRERVSCCTLDTLPPLPKTPDKDSTRWTESCGAVAAASASTAAADSGDGIPGSGGVDRLAYTAPDVFSRLSAPQLPDGGSDSGGGMPAAVTAALGHDVGSCDSLGGILYDAAEVARLKQCERLQTMLGSGTTSATCVAGAARLGSGVEADDAGAFAIGFPAISSAAATAAAVLIDLPPSWRSVLAAELPCTQAEAMAAPLPTTAGLGYGLDGLMTLTCVDDDEQDGYGNGADGDATVSANLVVTLCRSAMGMTPPDPHTAAAIADTAAVATLQDGWAAGSGCDDGCEDVDSGVSLPCPCPASPRTVPLPLPQPPQARQSWSSHLAALPVSGPAGKVIKQPWVCQTGQIPADPGTAPSRSSSPLAPLAVRPPGLQYSACWTPLSHDSGSEEPCGTHGALSSGLSPFRLDANRSSHSAMRLSGSRFGSLDLNDTLLDAARWSSARAAEQHSHHHVHSHHSQHLHQIQSPAAALLGERLVRRGSTRGGGGGRPSSRNNNARQSLPGAAGSLPYGVDGGGGSDGDTGTAAGPTEEQGAGRHRGPAWAVRRASQLRQDQLIGEISGWLRAALARKAAGCQSAPSAAAYLGSPGTT